MDLLTWCHVMTLKSDSDDGEDDDVDYSKTAQENQIMGLSCMKDLMLLHLRLRVRRWGLQTGILEKQGTCYMNLWLQLL